MSDSPDERPTDAADSPLPEPTADGEIHARTQTEQVNEELQEENAETSSTSPPTARAASEAVSGQSDPNQLDDLDPAQFVGEAPAGDADPGGYLSNDQSAHLDPEDGPDTPVTEGAEGAEGAEGDDTHEHPEPPHPEATQPEPQEDP